MSLTYPPFVASVILNEVAKKKLFLKTGSKGPAVALLQGALIDRGFKLPKSTNTKGLPDGIYGQETASAFVTFQTKNKLKVDGIAGSATVTLLDAQMTAAAGPPAHIPPTILPPPSTAEYKPRHQRSLDHAGSPAPAYGIRARSRRRTSRWAPR